MNTSINKVERVASKGLRYFFAPQLTGGMQGVRSIFAALVQTLAQTLARANLLERTHRSLNPTSLNDVRLGEVMAVAYANLRAPQGRKADQFAVFIAVFGLLALSTIYIIGLVLSTFIGVAHAALSLPSYDPGVCVTTPSTSIFAAPCATDMAQQWIDVLLLNDTSSWFYNQVSSLPLTAGMAALFGTYSIGMLVLAGFLVLYHVLSIVAETASQGHVGGRNFNHVWAPIRLVMAVGMLVPLGAGGGGLNSGQYMVTQFAKMGSGLASNAWAGFATSSAAALGSYIVMPTLPPVGAIMQRALKIKVCEKYLEHNVAVSEDTFRVAVVIPTSWSNPGGSAGKKISKVWDGEPTGMSNSASIARLCGSISMNNPDYESSGESVNFFATGAGIAAGSTFRRQVLAGHKNAIDAALTSGGKLDTLAMKIAQKADPNVQYVLTESDMNDFIDAVIDYRAALISAINTAVGGAAALNTFVADATARGWVSAGVWFNSIARINGQLIDASNSVPMVSSPGGQEMASLGPQAEGLIMALAAVDQQLAQYIAAMDTGSSTTMAPESNFAETLGVASDQGDASDQLGTYLKMVSSNWTSLLGGSAGDNMSAMLSTSVTGAANFKLNTANPLAELSALGTRIINFSLNAALNAQKCSNTAYGWSAKNYGTKADGIANHAAATEATCGGTPVSSFMISSLTAGLLGTGFTLAFLLPLMPFIRFMFGLLTWVIALFEAVVAIPLVALAHIKTEGEGLAGPMARGAYLLILQIFARPILMVFGLIIALLVFNLMIVALNEMYAGALRSVEGADTVGTLSGVAYTVIYGCLAYAFANASFKAIDLIPNQALQWIGGHSVGSIDESHRVASGVGQMGSMVGSAPSQLMNTQRQESYRPGQASEYFMKGGGGKIPPPESTVPK